MLALCGGVWAREGGRMSDRVTPAHTRDATWPRRRGTVRVAKEKRPKYTSWAKCLTG